MANNNNFWANEFNQAPFNTWMLSELQQISWTSIQYKDIDGLMQERHNSIANALELRLSSTNPSIKIAMLYRKTLHRSFNYSSHVTG